MSLTSQPATFDSIMSGLDYSSRQHSLSTQEAIAVAIRSFQDKIVNLQNTNQEKENVIKELKKLLNIKEDQNSQLKIKV
jgi:hypothetical protein